MQDSSKVLKLEALELSSLPRRSHATTHILDARETGMSEKSPALRHINPHVLATLLSPALPGSAAYHRPVVRTER